MWSRRLGDDQATALHVPANDDLSHGLGVLAGQAQQHLVIEAFTLSEGAPRFGGNAVGRVVLLKLTLLKERMQFNLVHRWNDAGRAGEVLEMFDSEVRDTDGAGAARLLNLDQGLP